MKLLSLSIEGDPLSIMKLVLLKVLCILKATYMPFAEVIKRGSGQTQTGLLTCTAEHKNKLLALKSKLHSWTTWGIWASLHLSKCWYLSYFYLIIATVYVRCRKQDKYEKVYKVLVYSAFNILAGNVAFILHTCPNTSMVQVNEDLKTSIIRYQKHHLGHQRYRLWY